MRPAILAGAMAIPREAVANLPHLLRTLTAKHQPMGADEATLVPAYDLDDEYVYVPRQFGLRYAQQRKLEVAIHTSEGFAADFPQVPAPRDYQESILDLIEAAFGQYFDFLFKAHTGWGKTIGSLIVASRLGCTTVVIVDQDNLKDQWLKALRERFDMTIESGHVGIVQGKKCDYQGKSVVIAMLQTLTQKEFPAEFYEYFGLAIVDEVHTAGAPTFSQVLRQFPATYRMGVSATPTRKDGLQKLLDYNLGPVRVSADKEHDESAVYVRTHDTVYSWYANISPKVGRIINEQTDDGSRNLLLAESALSLYESDRDTLVLSDRIEQLKHLQSLAYYLGADPDALGLYAGYDPIYCYVKDETPGRRPFGWTRHAESGELEYTPIKLQMFAKRIPKKKLAAVKAEAGMLFATYGMCAKGFDEPRLRAGVDASNRSEVEQIHGRILRVMEGLKMPIWVTTMDRGSYRLLYSFIKRIHGYLKSNGRMYRWHEDGELERCHEEDLIAEASELHRELKLLQIETLSDGRNTVVTRRQQMQREIERANITGSRTPRRRA